MAKSTGFSRARPEIISFLDKLPRHVLSRSEITAILAENRSLWRLTSAITTDRFIEKLVKSRSLKKITLSFPSKKVDRYTRGLCTAYEIAQSLTAQAHFSHYSAVFLQGLTMQVPKTIFIRQELAFYTKTSQNLTQESIDRTFQNRQRISKSIASYDGQRILLLNGKKTDALGVIQIDSNFGKGLRVTNVERTLIDIAVRPAYSGGISEVLVAYTRAQSKVSINKLVSYLKQIAYAYPYHQAIGFYLEQSGAYTQAQIALVEEIPRTFDFYLDYGIKNRQYSPKWRLFFPEGFQGIT